MKKILIALIGTAVCATANLFGQGTVTFANSSGTLVTDSTTSAAVPAGGGTVELFYVPQTGAFAVSAPTAITINPNGTVNFGVWEAIPTSPTALINPIAGRFSAGTKTTGADSAGGANVWLEVVGWTGTSADLLTAISANARAGASAVWSNPTGNPGGTPASSPQGFVLGVSGFNGLVLQPVPEPTTLALGGLGAAALLMFRRRK